MFGLTQREKRWKADEEVGRAVLALATTVIQAKAQIAVAEAESRADELERLRSENAELLAILRASVAKPASQTNHTEVALEMVQAKHLKTHEA